MDPKSLLAGLIAYALSVLASVLLVLVTYRVNTLLTRKIDEEKMLLAGHRSVAIALGAVVLCQAILLRHAVFPSMVLIRELLLRPFSAGAAISVLAQCVLYFAIVGMLSLGSVVIAAWLFARMTGTLREREEILKDNVAVATFFAFVLLAITLVVNEGLQDVSQSLIPPSPSGILRLP